MYCIPRFLQRFLGTKATIPRPYEARCKFLAEHGDYYPHYNRTRDSFETPLQIHANYGGLVSAELGQIAASRTTGGRVVAIRESSSKLVFLDLLHEGCKLQVILNQANFDSSAQFSALLDSLQRGDIISVQGRVVKTKRGELSVAASKVNIVTPCVENIPDIHGPDLGEEHRARHRHLDLIVRRDSMATFRSRSKIIQFLRQFLLERGFLEVETPIISDKTGGALAKAFATHLDALHMPLSLRIAPELYLKQLIVGGFDKIFELGKVFRNEGMDSSHNPEFTSCEIYQAFASAQDMMELTKELLPDITNSSLGSTLISIDGTAVDLAKPPKVIDIVEETESYVGRRFDLTEGDNGLSRQFEEALQAAKIPYDPQRKSPSYLFDKLVGHHVEPRCVQPTFLVNHPLFQSPLAKSHPQNPLKSARFELFIMGREIINAYSELNDPFEQKRRFIAQQRQREAMNDCEAHPPDADFLATLAAGMPPTAGLGIGVDRLVMLLTGKRHIRDVIFFPLLKPACKK